MHPPPPPPSPGRKSCVRTCPDWSRVEIRDSQVESGQSRLTLDSLTLCKGFREVRVHASPEKIRNLRSSNCWKCIQIVNPTTTTLFLYHFKSFTIPSGGSFWLLGGCLRTLRTPPPLHAYGPGVNSFNRSSRYGESWLDCKSLQNWTTRIWSNERQPIISRDRAEVL